MKIATLVFNPIQENTFLVWDETMECAIIDAGNNGPRENEVLRQFIANQGLKPVVAVNTHGHFDHALGVEFLKQEYQIPFALSKKDQFLLDTASVSGMIFGVEIGRLPAIDIDLEQHTEIRFGHTTLKVIPTPGHTPGHVALYEAESKNLFTGDTLFRESIGRTDLPGGDFGALLRSLKKLGSLEGDYRVCPGHEGLSTLEDERKFNGYLSQAMGM